MTASPKTAVQDFWDAEPCGTRYGVGEDDPNAALAAARYRLEPYILPFADFPSAAGKEVLEIGVGAGSDFANWVAHAGHATGVDLTNAGIAVTRERLKAADPARFTLRQADAENLPFADNSFDIVYSWGVLHHTPDTPKAFSEAFRVLRPGGVLKTMVYQPYSWVGLMLWVRYGLLRGKPGMTFREGMHDHLESPGTGSYTAREGRELLRTTGLTDIDVSVHLSPADLLTIKPSAKHQSLGFLWRFYPRPIIRMMGHRFGTHLLMSGRKPA